MAEEAGGELQYIDEGEVQPDWAEAANYTQFGYYARSGYRGVGVGTYAAYSAGTSSNSQYNVSIGHMANRYMTNGDFNTATGAFAGFNIGNGSGNVFNGYEAGYSAGSTNYNTYIGAYSGRDAGNTDGSVFLGYAAGYDADSADKSVFIGYNAGSYMDRANTLIIENSWNITTPLIYGEFDNNMVRVNGTFETSLKESSTANNKNISALSRNNTGSGGSDVGFSLENVADDYKWTFRTYAPAEGFAASKLGTGGTEFEVGNTGADLSTTVVKMGGVVVFENGHLVNTSGHELTSLVQEQSIKLAAQDKLLAETRTELKTARAEIAQLKTMKQKVAMMESILTNLALNTSSAKKEKVTLKLK